MKKQMTNKLFSARELCYIALFAAVIAISAQIAIPAAIPFTMQTFAVFTCIGLLGLKCGTAAICVYILLGAVGLPVFTAFQGGIGVLFSVTGGYILGFIPAALISGVLIKRFGRGVLSLSASMTVGMVICYFFGSLWFCILHGASFAAAFTSCVFPFVPFDIIKIALAVTVTRRFMRFV